MWSKVNMALDFKTLNARHIFYGRQDYELGKEITLYVLRNGQGVPKSTLEIWNGITVKQRLIERWSNRHAWFVVPKLTMP